MLATSIEIFYSVKLIEGSPRAAYYPLLTITPIVSTAYCYCFKYSADQVHKSETARK